MGGAWCLELDLVGCMWRAACLAHRVTIVCARSAHLMSRVSNTWLSLFPSSIMFSTHLDKRNKRVNRPEDFVVALNRLKQQFPQAKWFYLSDEDTFVHVPHLMRLLGSQPHTSPAYIGTHNCRGEGFTCQHNIPIMRSLRGWLNGGAGVVMSRALVDKMDAGTCQAYYSNHRNWPYGQIAADVVLACCVADFWPSGRITCVV